MNGMEISAPFRSPIHDSSPRRSPQDKPQGCLLYTSGAGELQIDYKARTIRVNGYEIKEGDWISLNGSTGEVYLGQVATQAADLSGDFGQLLSLIHI